MANTLYPNFVLESKLTDLLNTKMQTKSFMTVDTSLASEPGMIKKINKYTYTNESGFEKLAKGAKNTRRGAVSYTQASYEVKLAQQVFDYQDEDVMQDPIVIDMGMEGASTVMVNEFNKEYFEELAKASATHEYSNALSYDAVVDGIAKMNIEDEAGLFLIIGTGLKAEIRKDTDFKASRLGEILYNGQIGDICGVPVVVSKLCPADTAYLATKEAVTCFVKKDSEVEQARDAETRTNTVIMRKVNLIALTDETKVVKLTKQA